MNYKKGFSYCYIYKKKAYPNDCHIKFAFDDIHLTLEKTPEIGTALIYEEKKFAKYAIYD